MLAGVAPTGTRQASHFHISRPLFKSVAGLFQPHADSGAPGGQLGGPQAVLWSFCGQKLRLPAASSRRNSRAFESPDRVLTLRLGEIMPWKVDFPRKADGGTDMGWVVPLRDPEGRERLIIRFATAGEANAVAIEFRDWLARSLEVRVIDQDRRVP